MFVVNNIVYNIIYVYSEAIIYVWFLALLILSLSAKKEFKSLYFTVNWLAFCDRQKLHCEAIHRQGRRPHAFKECHMYVENMTCSLSGHLCSTTQPHTFPHCWHLSLPTLWWDLPAEMEVTEWETTSPQFQSHQVGVLLLSLEEKPA